MSFKKEMPVSTIKYSGIFDEHELLTQIKDWLEDHRYKFEEPSFKQKSGPEGFDDILNQLNTGNVGQSGLISDVEEEPAPAPNTKPTAKASASMNPVLLGMRLR